MNPQNPLTTRPSAVSFINACMCCLYRYFLGKNQNPLTPSLHLCRAPLLDGESFTHRSSATCSMPLEAPVKTAIRPVNWRDMIHVRSSLQQDGSKNMSEFRQVDEPNLPAFPFDQPLTNYVPWIITAQRNTGHGKVGHCNEQCKESE